MKWPNVLLRLIANVESGFGFPLDYQGEVDGEIPFYKVSDMNLSGNEVEMRCHNNSLDMNKLRELGARSFPPGTVIFPKIGAAIATEKKRILTCPSTFDNNVMGVIPREGVVSKYLFYWFSSINLKDLANPGHVPSIRKAVIEELLIPLPPLSEQRRIVEILDEVDRIRRLRKEGNQKAERIFPALFLKMFGRPFFDKTPEWRSTRLGNVLSVIRNGTTAAQNTDGRGYPVSRIETISDGTINPQKVRFVELDDQEYDKWKLILGDILFSHINSESHIGKTALYTSTPPLLVHGMNLLLLRPKQSEVVPEYLYSFLNMPEVRTAFRTCCKRAVNQASLNQRDIIDLEIQIPPLYFQKKFVERFKIIQTVLCNQNVEAKKIEEIFSLLRMAAFSSELTAKWREAHLKELLKEGRENILRLVG